MSPKTILEQYGLTDTNLERANSLANEVWVGEKYVVRIAKNADVSHTREALIALHALEIGIRTAKPLFWSEKHSIFEKLDGESTTPNAPKNIWLEMLQDLQKFHQHPFEPCTTKHQIWTADPALLESNFAQQLSIAERKLTKYALQPHTSHNLVFAHGDAWSANVLCKNNQYVALIDWGNAAWLPLEREIAYLEDTALELARQLFDFDLHQFYTRRLELLLWIGSHGRIQIKAVQQLLEQISAMPRV